MHTGHELRRSTYFDSVFLMGMAAKLGRLSGVRDVAVLMATPANQTALVEFGLDAGALYGAQPTDLVVALKADTTDLAAAALAQVDELLEQRPSAAELGATTLDAALAQLPGANLALISVPGVYAAYEARRALEHGLHVLLFSDNVPLADEIALKQEAAARGLLLMGPDCGTALLAGTGVGFANAVRRGAAGIVGPSGTGIQAVSTLIHRAGYGVSHAIGCGSHDLGDEVGGVTTLQALDALAADSATRVIVLVAKPPAPGTLQRVLSWIERSPKPVVTCLLGAGDYPRVSAWHAPAAGLAQAAQSAVQLLAQLDPQAAAATPEVRDTTIGPTIAAAKASLQPAQRYVRGLFAGGTFCFEAQQIFLAAGAQVRSDAPLQAEAHLADPQQGEGTSLIDLGDDVFTRGRPHPMIDASLRNSRILAEAADPAVAAILLDFILGYGAAADPAGDTLPAIQEAQQRSAAIGRQLAFIASVCGTDADPQGLRQQVAALTQAGVIVAASSTEAAACARQFDAVCTEPTVSNNLTAGEGLAAGWKMGPARSTTAPIAGLLANGPTVIALGVRLFSEALEAQRVPVVHVEWSPPAGGDPEMLDLLADLL